MADISNVKEDEIKDLYEELETTSCKLYAPSSLDEHFIN
jgi:hypothetical protein